MRRRAFFGALFTAAAAPVAPNRVYSFLWDQPLVTLSDIIGMTDELRRHNAPPREDGSYHVGVDGMLGYNYQHACFQVVKNGKWAALDA